ncbi:hypothetical protein [Pedobacter sp. N23S346]|uniref:hypothetical protein n=1 Tax=Pedobacter sp. N23S346 TaxID=3402750 RepID=UPI003AC4050C
MKNKILKLMLLVTSIAIGFAATANAQIKTISSDLSFPESVISDGHFLYVTGSGKTPDPMLKDGDGVIQKLTLDGKMIDKNISKTPLNAPKGTAITNGVLYVADLGKIVGISLKTGEKIVEIDFSEFKTGLLNDIAVKSANTFFVTATDIGQVFKVSLGEKSIITAVKIPEIKGANGICYDKKTNRLFVVGFGSFGDKTGSGEIGYISWKGRTASYHRITEMNGFFDGVQLIDANTLAVTNWVSTSKPKGQLLKINVKNGTPEILKDLEPINGPADIYFDGVSKSLLIPVLIDNKLLKYNLK